MLQSLYARLFVAFWIAMLLVLAGSFVVFELSGPPPHWVQRRTLFEDGLRLQADLAYETLDTEGPTAAAAQLEGLAQRTGIRMALLQDGEVVAGEVTDDELARVRRAPEAHAGVRELDAGDEHHELLPLEGGRAAFTRQLQRDYPFLGEARARRFASSYGSLCLHFLDGKKSEAELGEDFGAGLSAAEIDYLVEQESQ